MIGARRPDEFGPLAVMVPLRRRPSRLIASCRKWAAFGYQRPDIKVEAKI
jgi:hypothetical protein